MTGTVRLIPEDSQFVVELSAAGTKLVVVDFTASWCGPCQRIAPIFQELSLKYKRAVFLKVDVDVCKGTAESQNVTAMPTFVFYRNKVKVDRLTGADGSTLENKIMQLIGSEEGGDVEVGVAGHMDLTAFFNKSQCECLNESDDHPFVNCLQADNSYLESDCDEQLIIFITFNQAVKIHSLKMKAPEDKGPNMIKLFINQPQTLDFDQADKMEPTQMIEAQQQDLLDSNPIPLRYVKFQNVQNLQIFIKNNHCGGDVTQLEQLCLIGSPINTTNMGDFKRVAGKKGESH